MSLRDRMLLALAVVAPLVAPSLAASPALAADPVTLELTLRDHRFVPEEVRAPAGVPLTIVVRNEDSSAEEFESKALKVEKVVAAGRQITVRLRPLKAGRYEFVGEYHEDTAKGVLVVEAR